MEQGVEVRGELETRLKEFDIEGYTRGVKKRDKLFEMIGLIATFLVLLFLFAIAVDLIIYWWVRIKDPKF